MSRLVPPIMVALFLLCLMGTIVVLVIGNNTDSVAGVVAYLVAVLALVLGVGLVPGRGGGERQ